MTRTFRAYDTARNLWYKPEEVFVSNGNIWLDDEDCDGLIVNNDVALLQSTGVVDCKGIEIFDGDILQSRASPYQEDWKNWIVTWNDGGFEIVSKEKAKDKRSRDRVDVELVCEVAVEFFGMVVVGNIYDNHNLLEMS